ncbi:MAG: hypothetical protein EOP07_09975 [Proteobacteria bacterium]|nr:MAG: hypothetical protein EOP07_09975 [Pseudomonadota bacterium]
MKNIILVVLTSSLFTACMTQADKALWLEAKNTLGPKAETVTADAPVAAPEAVEKGEEQEIKTSKSSVDKDEVAPVLKDEGLAPKAKAN